MCHSARSCNFLSVSTCKFSPCDCFFSGKFELRSFLDMVAKIQSEKAFATTRNTISKMALQEQKNKDPNAVVFTDTSGYVSETSYIEWSRIYSIFYNDDFSCVDHNQPAYLHIRNSQLHRVAAIPPFMPYTDPVKWALAHVDPKEGIFHDIHNVVIASFHPYFFAKAYAFPTPK